MYSLQIFFIYTWQFAIDVITFLPIKTFLQKKWRLKTDMFAQFTPVANCPAIRRLDHPTIQRQAKVKALKTKL